MLDVGRLDGRSEALFLDFDGTLVDIAPTPDAVRVEPGLRAILRDLRSQLGGALAIVTGRAIASVDELLPDGLDMFGLHGIERRVGGMRSEPPVSPDLGSALHDLRAKLSPFPDVVIEDKRASVAVHWRLAPDAEAAAKDAAAELASRLGPGFKIQDGKAVREVVPAGAGKGAAIAALLSMDPYRGRRPVFAGDDRTDEDGFAAVNAAGGVSIKVGEGPTSAPFRAPSASAFRAWLREWRDTGRPGPLPAA